MYQPQSGLARRFRPAPPPDHQPDLTQAKVIDRNPAQNTVDVVTRNFAIVRGVPVATAAAGTASGRLDLPRVTPSAAATVGPTGVTDLPRDTLRHDTWATIAKVGPGLNDYVCLGFHWPESTQLSVATPGLRLDRHESDVVALTSPGGDQEWQFPDGTLVKVGTTAALTDLTATNYDQVATPWAVPDDLATRQFTVAVPIDAAPVAPAAKRKATISVSAAGIVLTWPGQGSVALGPAGCTITAATAVQLAGGGPVTIDGGGSAITVQTTGPVRLGNANGTFADVARVGDSITGGGEAPANGGHVTVSGTITSGSATVQAS